MQSTSPPEPGHPRRSPGGPSGWTLDQPSSPSRRRRQAAGASSHSAGARCRTVHRPGVPVRVLGRAGAPAAALALRRPACAGRTRMIVLTLRARRGRQARRRRARALTAPVRHADRSGVRMPAPGVLASRPAARSSRRACTLPITPSALLRRLRVRGHAGRPARRPRADRRGRDATPASIPTSSRRWIGTTPRSPRRWRPTSPPPATPVPAARALDHKLGGPPERAALHGPDLHSIDGRSSVPGFNPIEAYEVAIANRRSGSAPPPATPRASRNCSRWAGEPLATAEVALIMQTGIGQAREALAATATWHPAGADGYWTVPDAAGPAGSAG